MTSLNFDVYFSDLSEAASNPLGPWDVVGRLSAVPQGLGEDRNLANRRRER
jgi:hypothetical protein